MLRPGVDGHIQAHLKSGKKFPRNLTRLVFFFFFNWRIITLQYCDGFCHTSVWIGHKYTLPLHPEPSSHCPLHPIPLGIESRSHNKRSCHNEKAEDHSWTVAPACSDEDLAWPKINKSILWKTTKIGCLAPVSLHFEFQIFTSMFWDYQAPDMHCRAPLGKKSSIS